MSGRRLRRVAVALDTDDRETFSRWCSLFGPRVGVLKVGPRVFLRWGRAAVEEAAGTGAEVFLDLKFHDIPSTVGGAVGAARELGVSYLTVHAGGGRRMMEAAVEAAGDQSPRAGHHGSHPPRGGGSRGAGSAGPARDPCPGLGGGSPEERLLGRRLLAARVGLPARTTWAGLPPREPGNPLRRLQERRSAPGRDAGGGAAVRGGPDGDWAAADAGRRPRGGPGCVGCGRRLRRERNRGSGSRASLPDQRGTWRVRRQRTAHLPASLSRDQ